jgi:hypothetical protein
MSAHHRSPSLDLPAIAHLAVMQSAADLIRAGSSSSSSQPADPIGINSDISVQVHKGKEPELPAQRVLDEAFCITRLKEIRQLAGNLELKDFTNKNKNDQKRKKVRY